MDQFILEIQLKRIMKLSGIKINFITSLSNSWIINKTDNSFWILDINDDWSLMAYDETREKEILNKARAVIKEVDLATAVTKKLAVKYNVENKVIFLPNAVDIKHYVPAFLKTSEKVNEGKVNEIFDDISFLKKEDGDPRLYLTSLAPMKDMKNPVVGSYSGLSGNWSDFALVSKVEELLPKEYTMVCSGNIHAPTVAKYVKEYKNYLKTQRMQYLGYVDYSILPEFLSKLNVGLVMHRMDEFNTHSAPNKIWAYLAMGLPVVSTDFLTEADKEIYEELVSFCKTPEEYVNAIINSYKSDNEDQRKKRRKLAIRYSTENRAATLVKIITQRFRYR